MWYGVQYSYFLKGHGNEAEFLGFLHKSVPHESLSLPFEPFRVWLRIRLLMSPLHYLLSRSEFGLEFAEIFEAKIGTAIEM